MRVTVTGGTGFIGSAVVDRAKQGGHTVAVFDRSLGQDVAAIQPEDCGDAVIHLAGVLGTAELFDRPEQAVIDNVLGTLRVIQACEAAGAHLVLIGMPMVWRNVYQTTKACAAGLADAWHEHRGLKVTHVRAFNAYGPGQHVLPVRKIVPTFATAAWRGQPIEVWGDGEQLVDLIHVDQLAEVMVLAAERAPGHTEVIEAGSGKGWHVNWVAEQIQKRGTASGGERSPIVHLPMRAGEKSGTLETVSKGDGLRHIGLKLSDLEFDRQSLLDTVDWYREDRP